jgi:hypothetical protein
MDHLLRKLGNRKTGRFACQHLSQSVSVVPAAGKVGKISTSIDPNNSHKSQKPFPHSAPTGNM